MIQFVRISCKIFFGYFSAVFLTDHCKHLAVVKCKILQFQLMFKTCNLQLIPSELILKCQLLSYLSRHFGAVKSFRYKPRPSPGPLRQISWYNSTRKFHVRKMLNSTIGDFTENVWKWNRPNKLKKSENLCKISIFLCLIALTERQIKHC